MVRGSGCGSDLGGTTLAFSQSTAASPSAKWSPGGTRIAPDAASCRQ